MGALRQGLPAGYVPVAPAHTLGIALTKPRLEEIGMRDSVSHLNNGNVQVLTNSMAIDATANLRKLGVN